MKAIKTKLIIILCLMISALSTAQEQKEQKSWWQADGSLKIENAEYTFQSPIIAPKESIKESEMLLLNINTYNGEDQPDIDYGIYSKDLASDEFTELRVYHRGAVDGSNISTAPLFGFDFTEDNYLIYGAKTNPDNISTFTDQEESWDAFGYYAHGYSFSQTEIKSTDYKHLWNRPKGASWWYTLIELSGALILIVLVVAISVVTLGGADALIAGIVGIGTSLGLSVPFFQLLAGGLATTLFLSLSLNTTLALEHGLLDSSTREGALLPQFIFKTDGEWILPAKFINPENDIEKNFNKNIDAHSKVSFNCTEYPEKKCFTAPFREVVARMTAKNSHIKYVNIPGEIHKNLTPYQLFKNYMYITDETGKISTSVNTPSIEAITIFDSKHQILPRKLLYTSNEITSHVNLSNYKGLPTFYIASKTLPTEDKLLYKDLGLYGFKDGYEYRLYRYQMKVEQLETPFSFKTGPDGPYLVGDNIIENNVVVRVTKPNGEVRGQYFFNSMVETDTVNCIMGDKVEFKVTSSNSNPPTINGLPATWLAPMGREYYYHCDPSVAPGGIKPKVPFDVQSHYVSSNDAMVEKYPNWIPDDLSTPTFYTLTWTAQRRTEPSTPVNNKYIAQYKFQKADKLGAKLQRKSKSEGQIMDFLKIYNDNKTSTQNENGYSYNPINKTYYWNIDSDELIYLNTTDYNTNNPGWNGKVKRMPLYDLAIPNDPYSTPSLASLNTVKTDVGKTYEPWQLVREGDYLWDANDGYPKSGFAINELVDAYRQHYDKISLPYRGYEIEDFCLYKDSNDNCITSGSTGPGIVGNGAVYNGEGNGLNDNNKHPGLIQIVNGNQINIPIKVEAPLLTDHGFYGNVITPEYSSVNADIPLKVIGLPKGMDAASIARYSLKLRSYSLQDFPEDTYSLSTDGTYDSETGEWSLMKEKIGFEQAWAATLYFTPDPSNLNSGVIIGGAEWKNTNIAYVFTTKDPYGGDSCLDCLDLKSGYEEFADNYIQSNRYNYDFSTGHTQSFDGETFWNKTLRNYILDINDKNTRFVCMDALDNIWDMHGNAYYWGYRALAKQIRDDQLDENLSYILTNVTSGKVVKKTGRTFDFNPSEYGVGEYTLQIQPIIGGDASPKVGIKIVDFKKADPIDPSIPAQKANIYTRELFTKEKTFLGLDTDVNLSNYKVAYVDDVLSTYKYLDGYRADKHDNSKNRFASFNDYREDYEWKTNINTQKQKSVSNILSVQTLINNFNPISSWKPEWNNWLRHFSYGKFPNSFVTPSNDQVSDIDYRTEIAQLFDNSSFQINPFLRSLIWLAPTDYYGYRINGLMKTIVNLDEFFNNYAFSGNISPIKTAKLPVFVSKEQDLTDDEKYKLRLFRRLKNGEMIVYNNSINNLSVYQKNLTESTFIATNKSTNGIPLTIGQDLQTIQDYASAKEGNGDRSFPIPAAVTSYVNLYGITVLKAPDANGEGGEAYGGLGEDLNGDLYLVEVDGQMVPLYYNRGGGPVNTRQLADSYPNSDLNIGVLLADVEAKTGRLAAISNGTYDDQIDRLITFCKSRTNQTIYLRPGYEFDLVWNIGYQDTNAFKNAFRYIVSRFKAQSVNNVKFVWQAAASPFNYVDYLASQDPRPEFTEFKKLFGTRVLHDPWELEDWYPGDAYVDIVGLSYFENPDSKGSVAISKFTETRVKTQRDMTDKLLGIARNHDKPVMIAEITPRGYEIGALTKSNTHQFWDGPVYTTWNDDNPENRVKGGTVTVTAENIWTNFYQPLFDYVEDNGDVIKYFHYIDADWTSELQYQWTSEFQYWGDARVEANEVIKKKWQHEINKPKWIHGSSLHASSDLSIYDITTTSAKFTWPTNDQPEVAIFRLVIKSNPEFEKVVRASNWKSDSFAMFKGLTASTSYSATLYNIDYFGNTVGSIEKQFTTPGLMAKTVLNDTKVSGIDSNINIYPNPTSGELNIAFELKEASTVNIEIVDLNNRLLFSKSEARDSGFHTLRFDNIRKYISSATGLISVKVTTNELQVVKKIILK